MELGGVTLDVVRRTADVGAGPVTLSEREFLLLRHLMHKRGDVATRQELLTEVWGYTFDPGSNVVDVCVGRLRSKLGADTIETVRNVGYRSTLRSHRVEIAWGLFAAANIFVIVTLTRWETIPFHFVWVSLTIVYGFRTWRLSSTLAVLAVVMAVTTWALFVTVVRGSEHPDELTEVPLMAAMFVAMVWHAPTTGRGRAGPLARRERASARRRSA